MHWFAGCGAGQRGLALARPQPRGRGRSLARVSAAWGANFLDWQAFGCVHMEHGGSI